MGPCSPGVGAAAGFRTGTAASVGVIDAHRPGLTGGEPGVQVQRRTVDADMNGAMSRRVASRASSGHDPEGERYFTLGRQPAGRRLDLGGLQRCERGGTAATLTDFEPGRARPGEPDTTAAHGVTRTLPVTATSPRNDRMQEATWTGKTQLRHGPQGQLPSSGLRRLPTVAQEFLRADPPAPG